ncbi:MAG: methionine ABC transporter permease [Alphaproteobacteria bacterium]|jgi:D-methionine transport system permease protein|nr:ABC transporter permease [Alphaproteobacteria bacterium]
MVDLFFSSLIETLVMVIMASVMGVLGGVPLGVLLFASTEEALLKNKSLRAVSSFLVNALRSVPYLILVIALLPVTRWLVGTSLGTLAACVPLSVAAILLTARVCEEALRVLPKGPLMAAISMGATRFKMVTKILLPEALPSLVSGITLVIVNLIGFSAMAGTVGGGGLGDLAIRYGYQRYDTMMILEIVVVLVILVQIVQSLGDYWTKRLEK